MNVRIAVLAVGLVSLMAAGSECGTVFSAGTARQPRGPGGRQCPAGRLQSLRRRQLTIRTWGRVTSSLHTTLHGMRTPPRQPTTHTPEHTPPRKPRTTLTPHTRCPVRGLQPPHRNRRSIRVGYNPYTEMPLTRRVLTTIHAGAHAEIKFLQSVHGELTITRPPATTRWTGNAAATQSTPTPNGELVPRSGVPQLLHGEHGLPLQRSPPMRSKFEKSGLLECASCDPFSFAIGSEFCC